METERTRLRLLTLDDAEAVYNYFSDPEVTKFMDIEPCKDLKDAEDIIRYHLDDDGCRWGLFDKTTELLMGTVGFHCLRKTENIFMAEIGYDLSMEYWGKGFMTEALTTVISFGFNQWGFDVIDATVEPENQRSINVLKKLGFVNAMDLNDHLFYFYLEKPIPL